MSASEEAVIAFWKEHREQLRQSEVQRSTLTNFLLVIAAGLSALIVQQKFSAYVIPLAVFIVLIGVYGALTVAKYYERSAYHLGQARALTEMLMTLGALDSKEPLERRRSAHYEKFPRLRRIRLHHLWVGIHFGVALLGMTLLVICIAR